MIISPYHQAQPLGSYFLFLQICLIQSPQGFPFGSEVKNLPAMQVTWVQSLGREDPLEKEMATHSSSLAGEFHKQRILVGYSVWAHKELDTTGDYQTDVQIPNARGIM